MAGGGSAPSAPQMSKEEKNLLQKQAAILDQLNAIYGSSITGAKENEDILKRISGLYTTNADGTLSLNEESVKKQQELAQIQLDRYERALRGDAPVSEGTRQRKADEFKLLKENAARRGINISGEDLDSATSDSTAGAALLGQFKRSYGLLEDSERRGELAGGVNSSLSLMGAAQGAGPAALLGVGGGLATSYGQAAAPYQNQRMLEYQAALGQYGYNQQGKAGVIGSGLAGAGIGASVGGVPGALIGGAGGLLAGALGR
jgi:hypothetical protein